MSLEWTPDLSVGDETLDEQHKRLLKEVNLLVEVTEQKGANDELVEGILKFLDSYIAEHLTYEEHYMREHDYPDVERHKVIHDGFRSAYKEFRERFDKHGSVVALTKAARDFLGEWWIDHIVMEDQKYHRYIEEHEKTKVHS
ncbi:MAG: hemerythrin family protein [Candidatus Doudnabacteria bacterium]|nr:hemerythrin family protein [Candidatus Doudnabacteria bacterium]MCA9387721.1 hemerythrin family protein [Candidatus Andersenbacteria bacterium]